MLLKKFLWEPSALHILQRIEKMAKTESLAIWHGGGPGSLIELLLRVQLADYSPQQKEEEQEILFRSLFHLG